jgi:hypothetical protein
MVQGETPNDVEVCAWVRLDQRRQTPLNTKSSLPMRRAGSRINIGSLPELLNALALLFGHD